MEGGQEFQDYIQAEIHNNTINGKSIIYWQNKRGGTIPNGTGQIILVNCSDVIVTGQVLSNISIGLLIVYSSHIIIQNNTLSDNEYGILLKYSSHSIISENFLLNNPGLAIHMYNSKNNTISENIVFNNSKTGIWISMWWWQKFVQDAIHLESSGDSNIVNNTISNNHGIGIKLDDSGNSNLTSNMISNNPIAAVYLDKSGNNVILNNTLVNNGFFVDGEEFAHFQQAIVTNNTVNGKPVVFWQHYNARTIPNGAGQVILVNSTDVLVTGQNLSKTSVGLLAVYSPHVVIQNNTIADNKDYGILLKYSDDSIISENDMWNNTGCAIQLYESRNSRLDENYISNNSITGIYQSDWWNWYYSQRVIHLESSSGCVISNNTLSNNHGEGLSITGSSMSNIKGNIILNNSGTGIGLDNSHNSILTRNTVSNNGEAGIDLWYSEESTLSYNVACDNHRDGIRLYNCGNHIIDANTVSNNQEKGIYLYHSESNTISNNFLKNNGLVIDGWDMEDFLQATVINNTVNGKPLVYWQNVQNRLISNETGQIILINCTAVTVTNQVLTNCSIGLIAFGGSNLVVHENIIANNSESGIFMEDSTSPTISNNTITNNQESGIHLNSIEGAIISRNVLLKNQEMGLELHNCEDNLLENNTITNNLAAGIGLYYSRKCIILENKVSSNNQTGIEIYASDTNHLYANCIENNSNYGISLGWEANDNLIKFNDIIYNNQAGESQAFDEGNNNVFSRNYWDNWATPDGNADGIVDEPYAIEGSAENQDLLPLTSFAPKHHLERPHILYPYGREVLSGVVTILWAVAKDSWEHYITYDVYYSPDDAIVAEATWYPLISGLDTTHFDWNTTTVADGSTYRVKVIAKCSWGLQTESVTSGVFVIQNNETATIATKRPLLSIQNVGIIFLFAIAGLLIFLDYRRRSQ